MSSRFRIYSTRNLNLLLFFILFHLQISRNSFTINFFHMVVLINNRNNFLASNNRLITATFNKFERHNPSCYINRRFGTRIIIDTRDRKHNIIQPLCRFFNHTNNSHRITLGLKLVAAREALKFSFSAMFHYKNNRLNRIADRHGLRCIFKYRNLRHNRRIMNHFNGCNSGIIVLFSFCDNLYRVIAFFQIFSDGTTHGQLIIFWSILKLSF